MIEPKKARVTWLSGIALVMAALSAVAGPAHYHGQGQLEVVLERDLLSVELRAPLDALVGFERAPRTEVERRALASMGGSLRDGKRMFPLPEGARCALVGVELHSPVLDGGAIKGAHADLSASYQFRCAEATKLRQIETGLFATFPRLHKLDLQFIGPNGQRAAQLTPQKPLFAW